MRCANRAASEIAGVKIDISKVKTRAISSPRQKTISPRGRAPAGAFLVTLRPGQFVLGGSGHIAGIVNPPAANKYGYLTNDTLPETADEFRPALRRTRLVRDRLASPAARRPMAKRRCLHASGIGQPAGTGRGTGPSYVKFRLDAKKRNNKHFDSVQKRGSWPRFLV